MRFRIPILMTLILLMAITLSGCGTKTYLFSFKNEQDLINAEGEWFPEYYDYSFNSNGINIQEGNIACPLRFSGNITMTVKFWLNVSVDHIYWMGICLGDGTWSGSTENDIHVEMDYMGSVDESYKVKDHDVDHHETIHYEEHELTPGLNRNGYNVYILRIVGKHVTISLNDAIYADFFIENYDSEWFGPNLMSEWNVSNDTNYGVTFESIEVVYSGNTSPMPLPPI
jgi:hypothetical protein